MSGPHCRTKTSLALCNSGHRSCSQHLLRYSASAASFFFSALLFWFCLPARGLSVADWTALAPPAPRQAGPRGDIRLRCVLVCAERLLQARAVAACECECEWRMCFSTRARRHALPCNALLDSRLIHSTATMDSDEAAARSAGHKQAATGRAPCLLYLQKRKQKQVFAAAASMATRGRPGERAKKKSGTEGAECLGARQARKRVKSDSC